MENLHLEWADAQLKTRDSWLNRKKHCEFNLLAGIEHKLYGHLAYLQEVTPEPNLEEDAGRVLNLCILAFRPDFRTEAARFAALAVEHGFEQWLGNVQTAIDITGVQNWQPVLQALLAREALTEATRWWLNGRIEGALPTGESNPPPFGWSEAEPGQIPCLVQRRTPALNRLFETWLSEARDSVNEADRQNDLHWLALGLLAGGQQQQAMELLTLWTTANPTSRSAWSAVAASGDAEFSQPLQQAVLDERVPPFWLVVHGEAAHLEFCLSLLDQPNTNPLAERAWYGLTGERLPRVPALSLGDKKKGVRLACANTARQWLAQHRPTGRLCLGQDHTSRPFRPQLGRFFGADTEPAASAVWLDTQQKVLLNPFECHWQRARRLQEAQA